MSTPSGYLQSLIDSLRGGGAAPVDPSGVPRGPLEMQLDGYRLHVKEAKAMGETPLSYKEWLKQQPSIMAPKK